MCVLGWIQGIDTVCASVDPEEKMKDNEKNKTMLMRYTCGC